VIGIITRAINAIIKCNGIVIEWQGLSGHIEFLGPKIYNLNNKKLAVFYGK